MSHSEHCHGHHDHKHGLLDFFHGHSHDDYPVDTKEDRKRLIKCMVANGLYGISQLSVGHLLLHSMILVTDALQNVTDMVGLGIPLFVLWLRGRHRAALTCLNYSLLIFFLGITAWESAVRLAKPESANDTLVSSISLPLIGETNTGIAMAGMAGVGIAVNLFSVVILLQADNRDLNMKSAILHQLTDLVFSAIAMLGSAVIAVFGLLWVDPALTIAAAIFLTLMVRRDFAKS